MLGAYVGFAIGTLALTAAFTNAFIAALQPGNATRTRCRGWLVVVVGAVISFLLSGRDIRLLAKILLVIEGIGILAMVVLVIVIFAKGGAPSTGYRLRSVLLLDGGVRLRRDRAAWSRRSCPGRDSRRAHRWVRRPTIPAATSRARWPAR